MKNITDFINEASRYIYTIEFGHNEKVSNGTKFVPDYVDVVDAGHKIEKIGDKPGKYNLYEIVKDLFSTHYDRDYDKEPAGKDGGCYAKFAMGDHTKTTNYKERNAKVEINNKL